MTTCIWKRSSLMALALSAGLLLALAGCTTTHANTDNGDGLSGVFDITGSNTVTPLSTIWAEAFMDKHPNVNIAISGPGSGAGIAALIDGTTELCQSSRLIRSSEIDQAKEQGVDPHEIVVAMDGLAVVVNPANPISELTIEQLSAIYSGKVTNWKDVGGNDATIVVLSRDTNSGTHVFFKEQIVQMRLLSDKADTSLEYGPNVQMLPSTSAGVTETMQNANAIFYPGLGYVEEAKLIGVKKTANDPAVKPTAATVADGSYAVARPLLYYTNGQPTGLIKEYIDFCLSAEGQALVPDSGYVPIG